MQLHKLYYKPAPGDEVVPVEFDVADDELMSWEDALHFRANRTCLSRLQHRWGHLVDGVKTLAKRVFGKNAP